MAALAESYETEIDFLEYEEGLSEVSEEHLDPVMYSAMYPLASEVDAARRYMSRRGVTVEAALLADLRYDPDYSRIMFPVMDQMKTIFGYVGRSVYDSARPRVFTYPPLKKTKHLLGGHLVRDKFPKVVVEGQFAYATLLSKGVRDFCDVVAIMGQDMSQEQAALLLGFGNPVVLLLDGDDAGERGTHKALQILGTEILVTAPGYPDYAKGDPDNLAAADLYDMIYS
jgi:DNA primase